MTTSIKKDERAAKLPGGRTIPVIDFKDIRLQCAGLEWREFAVRLPHGLEFVDLVEPSIWSRVQGHAGSALLRDDKVRAFAADGSWCADFTITSASAHRATISKPVRTDLESRATEVLPRNETYEIRWARLGYVVFRLADDCQMTPPTKSLMDAERAMRNLGITRVA
jgi:hypothetical protein